MTARSTLRLASLVIAALSTSSVMAADLGTEPVVAPSSNNVSMIIELGAGGRIAPVYEGAKQYEVSPFPIISLDYLSIPNLFTIGSRDPQVGGFSIGPSFGYIGERDSGDYNELSGLSTVDATYEAGLKARYEWTNVEVYGAARYAFGGADGFVGEAGVNLIARPLDTLELKAGPTVSFASSDYMKTYFGVTAAESLNSGGDFRPYDPDGGFKSAGIAAAARYEFRPDWFLNADASWGRMIGDAKDSPIVETGDKDQYSFGLGLSKRFDINF